MRTVRVGRTAALLAAAALAACGAPAGTAPVATGPAPVGLEPVYSAYFQLQAALVKSELEPVRSGFEALAKAAADVPAKPGDAQAAAWQAPLGEIHAAASQGHAAADLEAARAEFRKLSKTLIELAKTSGHAGSDTFYVIYCPMALKDTGASWLQKAQKIENPYFGASMLECGIEREKLLPTGG